MAKNRATNLTQCWLLPKNGQGQRFIIGWAMRYLLSLSAALLMSSVAVAAPAHKTPATKAESFSARQTHTEKQADGVYDLSGLPAFTGKVAQFLPSPHGGVFGLLLEDGTQVFVSPEQTHELAGLVKPGDVVSIRGLKGRVLPIIRAFGITSPRGRGMQDNFIAMPVHSTEMIAGPDLVLHGEIWQRLYNANGQLSGVILKDHSVICITPREATREADLLTPGQMLYAVGTGSSGELGTAIDAREIGTSAEKMVGIAVGDAPPPGPPAGSPAYDIIPGAEEH
nr:OB-fold nucleic acid binding domain-containing protein [Acetobacter pomorum]